MKLPPIHTLTGNLLAEHTFTFPTWKEGRTQRATAASFQAGGKGINVSRMLRRLGVPNTALAFVGGESGAACLGWMIRAGLEVQEFHAEHPTRTGIVVRSADRAETTFFAPDTSPGASAVAACAAHLAARPDGEILAICGSLPGWSGKEFDPLRTELARWARRGLLVADTYGPPLAWLASQPLALGKINAEEFQSLHGGAAPTPALLADARARWPVRRWVITAGPGEIWVQDETGGPQRLLPPPVQEVSATGSGDVLLAVLLAGWQGRGLTLPVAVAAALPFAAANAAHPGIAEFPLPE